MRTQRPLILISLCSLILLHACGGSHGAYNPKDETVPAAITNLAGNAGDAAVSLGWNAPSTGTPSSYNISITPTTNASITRDGNHALIRGLTNGTAYTFSVTAKNSEGESPATTLLLTPTAVEINLSNLSALTRDTNDANSPSGIFDPSVLNVSGTTWMTYSSVNYYQLAGKRVQDVSTSLAYSNNGGASFTYLRTLGLATNTTITPASIINPCGVSITCSGRWVYEVPFLVDDSSDPDASKRFKLFAHKYFLYPLAATPDQSPIYALGAIVMWTAPSPESNWSNERVVLKWNLTPPELVSTNNINTLNVALNECLALSEGSATTYKGDLDFVFACSYPNAGTGNTQKIVMLRSSDHANTFKYVSTPLEAADAASFNAVYFTAPALIPTESNAPLLIATPVINRAVNINGSFFTGDFYSGCIAFPFADEETGKLFRSGSTPLSILRIGYRANHLNGACAWDRGISASGILINDGNAITGTSQFSILKTTKSF